MACFISVKTKLFALFTKKLDSETGELKQSYFDGVVSISLRGIKLGEKVVITRINK
jgi:hypothetical protein